MWVALKVRNKLWCWVEPIGLPWSFVARQVCFERETTGSPANEQRGSLWLHQGFILYSKMMNHLFSFFQATGFSESVFARKKKKKSQISLCRLASSLHSLVWLLFQILLFVTRRFLSLTITCLQFADGHVLIWRNVSVFSICVVLINLSHRRNFKIIVCISFQEVSTPHTTTLELSVHTMATVSQHF